MIPMPQPWTTSASATVGGADGIVTLVEGSSFCISSRSGEIDPDHPQGLFFRDTRFISELRLTLNGTPPEPLAATTTDPFSAVFVLRGHPSRGRADSHLVLVRRRYIGRGMREDIEIENYGEEAAFCSVELLIGADFADLFEVKEGRVHKQGKLAVQNDGNGRITFTYERSSFTRSTHVDFTGEPRISGSHVHYEVIVPPRGRWTACMQVTPVIGDARDHARAICAASRWSGRRRWPGSRSGRGDSPWSRPTTISSARCSIARPATSPGLRIFDPEFPDRAVVAAGAPWFMTLFGRDSLITSWMTMLVDPDLALGTLQTLARFQGEKVDPRTEEEPGRILHEMRFGETASLALGGGRIYYGTVDATPLFVMLVGELSRWGNRREEVDALLPAADRALEWITDYGDKDGDGYVEYQRTTDHGLQNQGWKDSWDSMRFADGTLAATRSRCAKCRATCTRRSLPVRTAPPKPATSSWRGPLRSRADELKRRFNEDFWVENEHGGYFALGLDRDKRRIDGLGSNMGHCLWTGIVDEEKAPHVAKALLSEGMFSGWGVRTLSKDTVGYNPISYHCGGVWPHDNAICAAGLMRYGFVDEAHQVMRGLVDASPFFGDLLPELFSGIDRGTLNFPVSYPTSCSPQAWAAASPLLFLRTLLRFEPDIRNSKLHLAPAVPDWIGTLRLDNIPLMGGQLAVEVEGEVVRALQVPEGLTIVSDPRSPTR